MAATCPATLEYFTQVYSSKLKRSANNGFVLEIGNGRQLSGVSSIAKHYQRTSNDFAGLSLEERMAVEQWLEYRHYMTNSNDIQSEKLMLQELNCYLQDKVYFVANQPTVADVLMYHNLHHILTRLTFQEKEKFIHVSRWFSNIQQDPRARQSLPLLPFLRTLLYDSVSHY